MDRPIRRLLLSLLLLSATHVYAEFLRCRPR